MGSRTVTSKETESIMGGGMGRSVSVWEDGKFWRGVVGMVTPQCKYT